MKTKGDPIDVLPGDPHEMYWTMVTGHAGNLAYNMGWSTVRTVCWNTARAALKEMRTGSADSDDAKGVRIVHKKRCREGIAEAAKCLDFARREFSATMEQMQAMARFGVNSKDLEKFFRLVVGGVVAKDLDKPRCKLHGNSQRTLELLDAALATAPGAQVASGTLYAAINAVTYWNTYTRGTSATTGDKRTVSIWTATGGKTNDAAFALAVKWMRSGSLVVPASTADAA